MFGSVCPEKSSINFLIFFEENRAEHRKRRYDQIAMPG